MYLASNHASVSQYMTNNIVFTLLSAAITILWLLAAWQRMYSIGVPRWVASVCVAALLFLWAWVITAPTYRLLAFVLFLVTQLPLLALPMRADRTNTAVDPALTNPK
jgi:hypothetical protein